MVCVSIAFVVLQMTSTALHIGSLKQLAVNMVSIIVIISVVELYIARPASHTQRLAVVVWWSRNMTTHAIAMHGKHINKNS